ncbi:hypothetical protein O181_045610 [Austropuccinia psidii MF-1]|uniref:Peptidase A1 domain-containing protein n=1 Tax=Austropuccinia psidii MF-1 TaxID=1389203 RepID=A0A9Q3DRQ7_9BASI|nr:hypothetical protein [Austropuccinia psidii MF-1]
MLGLSLVLFTCVPCVPSNPQRTNSKSAKQLSGDTRTFRLFKREDLVNQQTGLLNQEALESHLRYMWVLLKLLNALQNNSNFMYFSTSLRKQIIGATNYYMNTGNVLATANMTPYQLEDVYNSGSIPLITPNSEASNDSIKTSTRLLSEFSPTDPSDLETSRSASNFQPASIAVTNILSKSQNEPYFTALTKADPRLGVIGTKFVRQSTTGSEMTIGGADPTAFRGPFITLNVMAMPEELGLSFFLRTSQLATIDTGTSIIGVPRQDAMALYASIPGASPSTNSQFTFPCASLPSVSLIFGGRTFAINPVDSKRTSCSSYPFCDLNLDSFYLCFLEWLKLSDNSWSNLINLTSNQTNLLLRFQGKDQNGGCVGGIMILDQQTSWLVGQV